MKEEEWLPYYRAKDKNGNWDSVSILELDDDSFRRAVTEMLFRLQNAIINGKFDVVHFVKTETDKPLRIKERETKK